MQVADLPDFKNLGGLIDTFFFADKADPITKFETCGVEVNYW